MTQGVALPHYNEVPNGLQAPMRYNNANLLAANIAEIIPVPTDLDGNLAKWVTFSKTSATAVDFYAKPMLGTDANELTYNKDFAEFVTNGAFASDTGWTKGTGWSIAGGVATIAASHVAISDLTQNAAAANPLVASRIYNMTCTTTLASHVTNGTFAADANWTKGSGWSIGAGVATAVTASSTLSQTCPQTLVAGRTYTVVFDCTRSAGSVAISLGGGTPGTSRSSSATFTETITAGAAQDVTFTGVGFSGTLDNVVITAIGNLTMSLGGGTAGTAITTAATTSQAITAGSTQAITVEADANFVGTVDNVTVSGWTLGTGWTTDGATAIATGNISTTITLASLTPGLVSGGKYLVTFTATQSNGSVAVSLGGGAAGASRSTSATFSEIITASTAQDITFTGSSFAGTIDNVSVTKCIAVPGDTTDGSAPDLNPPGFLLNKNCIAISIVSAGTPIIVSSFYK